MTVKDHIYIMAVTDLTCMLANLLLQSSPGVQKKTKEALVTTN